MKNLLGIVVLGLLWIIPVSADDNCVDKNPEIILDLGGTPEPEKIVYSTSLESSIRLPSGSRI